MKGIVDKRIYADENGRAYSHGGYGFIMGEDGNRYFFHSSDIENCNPKKLLTHNIVSFTPAEENGEPRAKMVYKTGYGKKHPYLNTLADMKETITHISISPQTKRYFLRDVDKMIKYFSVIEDYEKFKSLLD